MNDVETLLNKLVIRSATPEDAEACYLVHRAAAVAGFAHIFAPDQYPFPEQPMKDRWRRLTSEADVLLAELEGRVIATAGFDATEFISFFVLPEYWGSGVARILYNAVMEKVRPRGDDSFSLFVLEQNFRARHFYEKRGWKPTGTIKQTPFPPNPNLVQYAIDLKEQSG